MSRYYDIHNISKDRWKSNVTLHLVASSSYSYHSLVIGSVLKNVKEEQVSEQMRMLAKSKRDRPPVIELKEVDYEARQAGIKKARELAIARGKKKLRRKQADKRHLSLTPQESGGELSDGEQEALEFGTAFSS